MTERCLRHVGQSLRPNQRALVSVRGCGEKKKKKNIGKTLRKTPDFYLWSLNICTYTLVHTYEHTHIHPYIDMHIHVEVECLVSCILING